MIKREPAAVFLDIDGTLLSGTVPQKNIDAIARVQKEGHKVLLNTGRAFGFIPWEKLGGIRFDGVVAGAGAYVEVGGQVLLQKNASPGFMTRIVHYFFGEGKSIFLEGQRHSFAVLPEPSFDPFGFGARVVSVLSSAEEWDEKWRDEPITKVAFWRTDVTDAERDFLREEYRPIEQKTYTETMLIGCDKATGMKLALSALGIPRERSIAMGDSPNDIEMLTYAGMPVAMGNATEDVKAMCRLVSSRASEGGVADALDRLL